MRKLVDEDGRRLICISEKADSQYWDDLWSKSEGAEQQSNSRSARQLARMMRAIMPVGKVLEAGCGHGGYALALANSGWEVSAVDFAPNTVEMLRSQYPALDIRLGDVRNLEFANNSFDAYYSGGVIEHFWQGYSEVISEAHRVLVPGGLAVFTFPAMNPLRRMLVRLGHYPTLSKAVTTREPEGFYQFILDLGDVKHVLQSAGFRVVRTRWTAATLGLIDEFHMLRTLYNMSPLLAKKLLSLVGGSPIWGHSVIVVVEKRSDDYHQGL